MFKDFLKVNLPKLIELIVVVILGFLICLFISSIFSQTAIGVACVAIVFYYFGGIIRPYIKELQEKITKNIGKKNKESDKK